MSTPGFSVLLNLGSIQDDLYQSRSGLRSQVNFDYDTVPASGKETTDRARIFKRDYAF